MKKVRPELLIRQLIMEKEAEQRAEGVILKEHFLLACESLKPGNILKSALKEALSSPDIGRKAVNAAIGLATGIIARKVFTGQSRNVVRRLTGIIVEMVVARKVARSGNEVAAITGFVLKKIIKQDSKFEKAM